MRLSMKSAAIALLMLCVLLLGGCSGYLAPQPGSLSVDTSRIALKGDTEGSWSNKDMVFRYHFREDGEQISLTGKINWDISLVNSFRIVRELHIKLNFLDDSGRVLETVSITPFYQMLGNFEEVMDVEGSWRKPEGATAVAVNYYGAIRGSRKETGLDWIIFYFPFDKEAQ